MSLDRYFEIVFNGNFQWKIKYITERLLEERIISFIFNTIKFLLGMNLKLFRLFYMWANASFCDKVRSSSDYIIRFYVTFFLIPVIRTALFSFMETKKRYTPSECDTLLDKHVMWGFMYKIWEIIICEYYQSYLSCNRIQESIFHINLKRALGPSSEYRRDIFDLLFHFVL